jgi:hypothetical protein
MSPENLSRRAIRAGAASVPALAVPAVAKSASADPDPILAAIEAHRRAWVDLDPCSELDEMASEGNEEAAQQLDRLHQALNHATEQLLDIAPTTIAGVAAVLAYAAEFVTSGHGGIWPDGEVWMAGRKLRWEIILHKNLAKTLQAMAVQS